MKIVTAKDMQTDRGPEDWFTGTVWRDATPVGPRPTLPSTASSSSPARTHWHTHPEGQILYIVTGTCRAAEKANHPSR